MIPLPLVFQSLTGQVACQFTEPSRWSLCSDHDNRVFGHNEKAPKASTYTNIADLEQKYLVVNGLSRGLVDLVEVRSALDVGEGIRGAG